VFRQRALPKCQGCGLPIRREILGYAQFNVELGKFFGGIVACRNCTAALVAVGGSPMTLWRLSQLRGAPPTGDPTIPMTPRRQGARWKEVQERIEEEETARIIAAVRAYDTVAAAAEHLGLRRTTLHMRIAALKKKGKL
jgi:transcriptional regulator of acetoin/glycerol metabolism